MKKLITKFSLTFFGVVTSAILTTANEFSQTQSLYFVLTLSVLFIFIAWIGDTVINYQIDKGNKYARMWDELRQYANLIYEKGGDTWGKSRLAEYMDKLEKEIEEDES